MQRWLKYCEAHKWAYVISLPVLVPYSFYLLFKALCKWGDS